MIALESSKTKFQYVPLGLLSRGRGYLGISLRVSGDRVKNQTCQKYANEKSDLSNISVLVVEECPSESLYLGS